MILIPQEVFTILSLTAFSEWQPIIFSRSRSLLIVLPALVGIGEILLLQ